MSPNTLWADKIQFSGSKFTNSYTIAYLVLSLLAFLGFLFVLRTHGKIRKLLRPEAIDVILHLKAATVFYILSYFLQILDLLLREERVVVYEGYFFTYVFRNGWLATADMLVILMICRLSYKQFTQWEARRVALIGQYVCGCLLIVLTALALYRFGVYTADLVLGLNNVSYSSRLSLIVEENRLNAAFLILYLILSGYIFIQGLFLIVLRTKLSEKLDSTEARFLTLNLVFFIRSITSAVIATHYQLLGYPSPVYLGVVSEALFGLPTVLILYLMHRTSLGAPASAEQSDILRQGRRMVRKELKRSRRDAEKGGPALPSAQNLLEDINRNPMAYLPVSAEEKMTNWDDNMVRNTLSTHVKDIMKMREKFA